MAVATSATLGIVELGHRHKLHLGMTSYHHLGNALAIVYHKVVGREVHQQHHQLATIVGINGAGRIEYGDALFRAKPLRGRTCAS